MDGSNLVAAIVGEPSFVTCFVLRRVRADQRSGAPIEPPTYISKRDDQPTVCPNGDWKAHRDRYLSACCFVARSLEPVLGCKAVGMLKRIVKPQLSLA